MDPTPVLGSGPCPCRLGTYADPTTLLYALFPLWSLQHLLTAQVRPRAAAACRRCCAPGHDPGAPSPCTPLYIALHFALNCLAYGVACDVMAAASEQSEIYWGFPAAVGWAVRCVGLYLLLLCLMDPGRSFDFRMQYYYHHRVAEGAGPGDAGIRPRGLSRVTRHLLLLGACITSLSFLLDAAVQGCALCFYGIQVVMAVLGMWLQDVRMLNDPHGRHTVYMAETTILPRVWKVAAMEPDERREFLRDAFLAGALLGVLGVCLWCVDAVRVFLTAPCAGWGFFFIILFQLLAKQVRVAKTRWQRASVTASPAEESEPLGSGKGVGVA